MDKILEIVKANPEIIGTVMAIVFSLLWKIKSLNKYLGATAKYALILADSIEKTRDKQAGDIVVDEIKKRVGTSDSIVRAVNDVIVDRVDPKLKEVPAIKRFWRRLISGENVAGKLITGTIASTIESQVKRHIR